MNALLEKPPLPAFVHGEVEVEEAEFRIDDERKAAWAAGKILSARRRMDARSRLAQDYQTRVLDWLTSANQADEQSVNFLEGHLRPWVESEVAKLGKSRSLKLLGAKVGLRKRPDRVEIYDPDLALGFCEFHLEEVIVTKKEVSKSELKKHLAQGAMVPGASLVPGLDEMTVSED